MSRPFHVLAKPAGAACNLDCAYCFYLDKAALYPDPRPRMREAVLDRFLRQLADVFRDQDVVPLAWQGGEPTLMGLDFFRDATRRARSLLRPGQVLEQSLQTNGLLLDEQWCTWLATEDVLVGLSIDGPADLHDAYRVDRGGAGSSGVVLRSARRLREAGVRVNAMVTVHAANASQPLQVYRFLRDELRFEHLQLIPIVERRAEQASERSVEPRAWGAFLVAVFDEWLAHDVGRVFVPTFEAALASWLGLAPALCIFRETCGDAVVLEHNGDVYACDHFVDEDHLLGNVSRRSLRELVEQPAQQRFGLHKRDGLPQACRQCPVLFACRGGCPKDRFATTAAGEPGLHWLCTGYLNFFTHSGPALQVMAGLVGQGRPADRTWPLLQALGDRGRRNEPCPCGSGQKLKRCHGARH